MCQLQIAHPTSKPGYVTAEWCLPFHTDALGVLSTLYNSSKRTVCVNISLTVCLQSTNFVRNVRVLFLSLVAGDGFKMFLYFGQYSLVWFAKKNQKLTNFHFFVRRRNCYGGCYKSVMSQCYSTFVNNKILEKNCIPM